MRSKIAFFTEGNFSGKIPRDHPNRRTDLCWQIALDSTHHSIWDLQNVTEKYDLGICIIPKKNIDKLSQFPLVENMRRLCKKIVSMQEGPNWFWEDYTLPEQIWYYNTLQEMDFILCHNESDVKYYQGLTDKSCYTMPPLMLTDNLKTRVEKMDAVIIGGNFCSWYSGMPSYITAMAMGLPIYVPSMGRKIEGEEQLTNLTHLPYMSWTEWITALSEMKYAVHLMRIHAAGTFFLNTSWLGIPSIGYKGLDTAQILHSDLTVELGDLTTAKKLLLKLKTDGDFYIHCSETTKENYEKYYTEEKFIIHMNEIFKKELGDE